MFDYARNMQLALTDVARRTAMKVAGGVVIVLGAGFLLAALWTFLADTLGWGPLWASLAIGVLFVVIGLVVMSRGGQVKHPVPTADDLKAEVETRVSLAADAALEKARVKATEVVDTVEDRVNTLVGGVTAKAQEFADQAEAKVHGFTRTAASNAASRVGLTPRFFTEAQETLDSLKSSNAATITPLLAVFAAGVAIASRVQSWRHQDDYDYDDYEDDDFDRRDLSNDGYDDDYDSDDYY